MPIIQSTGLSPGEFTTLPEITAYLDAKRIERQIMHDECEEDPAQQEIIMAMIADKKHGTAFFINNFGVTFEPRRNPLTGRKGEDLPFLLFPAQEEFAQFITDCIEEERDGGGVKPRDLGATWIALHCCIRMMMIEKNFNILASSHHEKLNDEKGAPGELFAKVDYILKRLPAWMQLPLGYDPEDPLCKMKGMRYLSGTNSRIITGAPTNKFGVADRQNLVLLDDWGRWQYGYEALESAEPTTNCRFVIWSVNEDDPMNHAYEYHRSKERFEGVASNIFELSWKDDLRKRLVMPHPVTGHLVNKWLLEALGDLKHGISGRSTPQQVARSYFCDYEASTKGRIYGLQMPYLTKGDFKYDRRFAFQTGTGTDFGLDDSWAIVWIQWDYRTRRFRLTRCYQNNGYEAGFYVPFYKGLDPNQGVQNLPLFAQYSFKDLELIKEVTSWQQRVPGEPDKIVPYEGHYGDPAGRSRDITSGKSVQDIFLENGILIENNTKAIDHNTRIDAVRRMIPFLDVDEQYAEKAWDALSQYKFGKDGKPEHGGPTSPSHIANAIAYFAVNTPHLAELYPGDEDNESTDKLAESASRELRSRVRALTLAESLQGPASGLVRPAQGLNPSGDVYTPDDYEEGYAAEVRRRRSVSGVSGINQSVIMPDSGRSSYSNDGDAW